MNNQKKLKKYAQSFIQELSNHLNKGFKVNATIHPADAEGAIIEFEIHEGRRSEVNILDSVPRINNTLERIDQRMIGGNIQGVTFRGTNLYMDGQRIVIIKGDDAHNEWSKSAATEDVKRVVSPKDGAK
jgi:hypothetical protein